MKNWILATIIVSGIIVAITLAILYEIILFLLVGILCLIMFVGLVAITKEAIDDFGKEKWKN